MRDASRRMLLGTTATMVLFGTWVAAATAPGHEPPRQAPVERSESQPDQRIEFEPGQRIDSAVCGTCHADIYAQWSDSVHAGSYRDPVFQAALARAIGDAGPDIALTCLTCHSPATVTLSKRYPEQVMEGVNCQFCHVLRGSHPGRFPPFDLDRELVMYGTLGDAESPAHGTRYSPFMETAEYCATCHEYTGPAGAAVLSTFTEYTSGSYPRLSQCQGCHMPLVQGLTVAPEVKETGRGPWVDFHGMRGGRDIDQLRRAVGVDIDSLARRGGVVAITVGVENRAAGHWLPTGMPSRRFVLEVSSLHGDERTSRAYVFGRRVIDAEGRQIRELARMILNGRSIVADTRLRPRQRRTFDFELPAPQGVSTRVLVRLYYESTELQDQPPVTGDVVRIERAID